MSRKTQREPNTIKEWTKRVSNEVDKIPLFDSSEMTTRSLNLVRGQLTNIAKSLIDTVNTLDPIQQPESIFDPADPNTISRIVGLALLAQPRSPLSSVDRFYGSGIYAIYYQGDFSDYAPISGTDHPIYLGKADPDAQNAKTPIEQGEKLAKRLKEHYKSVSKASNLDPNDFECRFLVVTSGWQEAAERHLISLYRPVWNKETKICYGIGKHGDSAGTRGNKRSPWDTLHSGRAWASDTAADQRSATEIAQLLADHFTAHPPLSTREQAMDLFLDEMCQT